MKYTQPKKQTNHEIIVVILLTLCLSGCSKTMENTSATEAPHAAIFPTAYPSFIPENAILAQTATIVEDTPEPVLSLAPVSNQDIILGNSDAENTLLVYADFQSPASAVFVEQIPELLRRHPDSLRIVFRAFPLITVNDKAQLAAQAVEAAANQDFYWPLASLLFSKQVEWSTLSPEDFQTWLLEEVPRLESTDSIDLLQFEQDLNSEELREKILTDFYQNVAAGLFNAPALILNGEEIVLPLSIENIEASIRFEELRFKQLPGYPEFSLDIEKEYRARIETTNGTMEVLLYTQYAPLAVNSFVTLAEMGWYDNTPIYRVVEGSYIEAGDPTGTGLGNPGYIFPTEIDPMLDFSEPGMVALVAPAPDGNGSNFFITLKPLEHLNSYRTIFGRVTEGLELLTHLQERDPIEYLLSEPDAVILTIEIERTQ